MVSINYSAREVCCKIVYYGPGLSGKTTNLQYIHSKVPQDTRGKLISLATEADRTLYFDFLPINIGTINDFQAKFQLYTVPGQVYYNATRKLVLRGVDGLVFVADSQADKMDENIESLANLEENIREYGYDPDTMPIVLQYNKRDLPGALSVEELNARLNPRGLPIYEASATLGNGVFDTLKLIIKLVLDKAKGTGASAAAKTPTASAPPPPPPAAPTPYPADGMERVPADEPSTAPTPEMTSGATPQPVAVAAQPIPQPLPPTPEPVAAAAVPESRPYPGSEAALAGERKAPVAGYNNQSEELSADSLGKNIKADSSDDSAAGSVATNRPQMAPSLRRRGGTKKRGFLKRLFGIK
jgi:hypothetical protein